MKKALSIFLCLLLCLPLAAGCTDNGSTAENGTETTADTSGGSESASTADAPLLTGIKIAGNDISEYVIVKPADASESEAFAAEELAAYIEKTCGSKLEIVTETASEKTISLIRDTSGELGEEGFHIKTAAGKVTITGGTVRGCLYGVYEFLDSCIGWRFLTNDVEYLKAEGAVEIADGIDDRQVPVFELRQSCAQTTYSHEIMAKTKQNMSTGEPKYGGAYPYMHLCHSIRALMGQEHGTNPCLTDEDVYQQVLAGVLRELAENRSLKWISVSLEDTQQMCTCDNCTAIAEEEGADKIWEDGAVSHESRLSGTLVRFVNRIAEGVYNAGYTDVMIQTLAYLTTEAPPTVTKARDNVLICFAPIYRCYNHAMDNPACNEFGGRNDYAFNNVYRAAEVAQWGKICDNLMVYEYCVDFSFLAMIFPCVHVMRDDVRYYAENGVKWWYTNSTYNSTIEFTNLRGYLLAKLLWNPYMTEEEYQTHIDDFLKGYYGSGWEEIRTYLDFTEDSMEEHGNHMYNSDMHFPENNFVQWAYLLNEEELEALFDRALAACTEAGEEKQAENIRILRLSHDYVKLTCNYWSNYVMGSEKVKAEWLAETRELYDAFMAVFSQAVLWYGEEERFVEGVPPVIWQYANPDNPRTAGWFDPDNWSGGKLL